MHGCVCSQACWTYRPGNCIQLREYRWRCLILIPEFSCITPHSTRPTRPVAESPYAGRQTENRDKPHHVQSSHCPFLIRRVENRCAFPEKRKNSYPPPTEGRILPSVFRFESTGCTLPAPNPGTDKNI